MFCAATGMSDDRLVLLAYADHKCQAATLITWNFGPLAATDRPSPATPTRNQGPRHCHANLHAVPAPLARWSTEDTKFVRCPVLIL